MARTGKGWDAKPSDPSRAANRRRGPAQSIPDSEADPFGVDPQQPSAPDPDDPFGLTPRPRRSAPSRHGAESEEFADAGDSSTDDAFGQLSRRTSRRGIEKDDDAGDAGDGFDDAPDLPARRAASRRGAESESADDPFGLTSAGGKAGQGEDLFGADPYAGRADPSAFTASSASRASGGEPTKPLRRRQPAEGDVPEKTPRRRAPSEVARLADLLGAEAAEFARTRKPATGRRKPPITPASPQPSPDFADSADSAGGGGSAGSAGGSGRGGGWGKGGRRGGFGGQREGQREGRWGAKGRSGREGGDTPENADPYELAREICLRQLATRPRTRKELALAMRKRGVAQEVADAVLDRYGEVGMIDDAAFARAWVSSRHHSKGLAGRALAQELRQRGVEQEVAQEALSELDSDTEAATALDLAMRKLRSTRGEPEAVFRKLVGMLARKGYSGGVAVRAVKEALATRDAELADLIDPDVYEE